MPSKKTTTLIGRPYVVGNAEGEALVINGSFSLLGSVNLEKGIITKPGHEHDGESIVGKVLVYFSGKGSSGDTSRYWKLRRNKVQPAAIINMNADPIHVQGAMVAQIPMVCDFAHNPIEIVKTGDYLKISGPKVEIWHK